MLRPFLTESEVTDDLKGAYEVKNGRYELKKLADDHQVVAHNKTLVAEKSAVETERDSLKATLGNVERERDEFKTKSVPSGYRAVTKEIAELGEAAKAAALTKEDVPQLKAKVETLESEKAVAAKNDARAKAFEASGFDKEKSLRLAKDLDFEIQTETVKENGGDVVKRYAVTKDGAGAEVKTEFKQFVESSDNFKPFLEVLKVKEGDSGFQFGGQGEGGAKNDFDRLRQEVRDKQKTQTPGDNASVLAALSGGQPMTGGAAK